MGKIMDSITRAASVTNYHFQVNKPEIYMGVGIAGVLISGFLACRATLKLEKTLKESREKIEKIHEDIETGVIEEKNAKKEVAIGYIYMGAKVVALYAPSVVLAGASITAIVASNDILKKRAANFANLYAASQKAFKDYRGRVAERFGKEVEEEIYLDKKKIEVEETKTDENGNETTEKKEVTVAGNLKPSEYSRIYDCGNKGWTKDPEANMIYLRRQQDAATDKLRAKGYLFLNDVYEMLGFPPCEAGHYVGWIDDPELGKDRYVDFGIYRVDASPANSNFINGYEPSILLDFNVDGPIMDKVWSKRFTHKEETTSLDPGFRR